MRGDLERILDMIEMCDLLLTHASKPETLERDAVVQAAAQRWIEVLGEAASRVSEDLKTATPDIPWRELVGIRVILAHAYFHIDRDIVSGVITSEIPALHVRLMTLANQLGA